MELDQVKILEAIKASGVVGEALEEGARLVDHWIEEAAEFDSENETLAVEEKFYIELDPLTFVVGTQDRIFRTPEGEVCGSEWKSTKHRTKFWNEEEWFGSISKSHQVVTYAAGLRYGSFLSGVSFSGVGSPTRILVRAVSKSNPPELWPDYRGRFVHVGSDRLVATMGAYSATAAAIRAMRRTGEHIWQVPGLQCENKFRKVCPFYESCLASEVVPTRLGLDSVLRGFSPGSKTIVQHLVDVGKINVDNVGEVVVLSASSLSSYQQCPERWRREAGSAGEEESEALDVGTVLHAGLAALYEQQMKKGEGK